MSDSLRDQRIVRGMTRQLEARRRRLAVGEKPLGWKVGFGAPAALARFGLSDPLVGFLLQSGRVESGGVVRLDGWTRPALEPEIVVYIGQDLDGNSGPDEVRAAVAALGPALELADVDKPPEDVETILAGNIFQRHVVLGPASTAHASAKLTGLTGRVFRRGVEVQSTAELEANTGRIVDIVYHVAHVLGAFGERLRAGEIIIAGSVVAPLIIESRDDSFAFALEPIGRADVRLAQA